MASRARAPRWDELNIPKRGGNHGWPKVTFGREYRSDEQIGDEPPLPGFEPPIHHWTPAIAPSGMTFTAMFSRTGKAISFLAPSSKETGAAAIEVSAGCRRRGFSDGP